MKAYLIISQLIYLISLIPWFVILGLSFMSFDSGINLYNVSFVSLICVYPAAVIICSITAWLFRVTKKRLAIILNLLPLLWIFGFLCFIALNG